MKYKVIARLKVKKLEREFDSDWDMKEFIQDWGKNGITNFRIEIIQEKPQKKQEEK